MEMTASSSLAPRDFQKTVKAKNAKKFLVSKIETVTVVLF
jgi:hypothetical protein